MASSVLMLVSVELLLLQYTCDHQTCATSIYHHIATGVIALGYTSELARCQSHQ